MMPKLKKIKKLIQENPDIFYLIGIVGSQELFDSKITPYFKENHESMFPDNDFSDWMDSSDKRRRMFKGYHRLYNGHDIASNFIPFVQKFGISKLPHFFIEIGKDSLTPNGIPLLFVQKLARTGLISDKILTKYFSINFGDVVSGGVAIAHSRSFYKRYKKGFKSKDIKWGFPIVFIKLGYGIVSSNPIIIATSIFDVGVTLNWNLKQRKKFKQTELKLEKDYKQMLSTTSKLCNQIDKDEIDYQKTDRLVEEALGYKKESHLNIIKGGKK